MRDGNEAVLECYIHGKHEQDVRLHNRTIIGRGKISANQENQNRYLQIEHMVLSKEHGEFYQENGHWWYRDLESSNGTLVNGVRLNRRRKLLPNDEITAGNIQAKIVW